MWIGIAIVVGMVIVLVGVYVMMQGVEPPQPSATEPPETQPSSYYDPADFQLDENGFMTCLTADYATGIDVSFYQGDIDWQQVKAAGVEFVFIRVGGRGTTEGKLYEDEKAQQYYKEAKAADLKVGAYFYSQALTPKEAEEEAWFVLKSIAGSLVSFHIKRELSFAWLSKVSSKIHPTLFKHTSLSTVRLAGVPEHCL